MSKRQIDWTNPMKLAAFQICASKDCERCDRPDQRRQKKYLHVERDEDQRRDGAA
jgi:hypothetical protein